MWGRRTIYITTPTNTGDSDVSIDPTIAQSPQPQDGQKNLATIVEAVKLLKPSDDLGIRSFNEKYKNLVVAGSGTISEPNFSTKGSDSYRLNVNGRAQSFNFTLFFRDEFPPPVMEVNSAVTFKGTFNFLSCIGTTCFINFITNDLKKQ